MSTTVDPLAELRELVVRRGVGVAGGDLRSSYAQLAVALIGEQDGARALDAIDRALACPGSAPPEAYLHELRTVALLMATNPDGAEVLRSTLLSVLTPDAGSMELLRAVARAVSPEVGRVLRTWARDSWLPQVRLAADGTPVAAAAAVIGAVLYAVDGRGTPACRLIESAAASDAVVTRAFWTDWLTDGGADLLATTAGGPTYAAALQARAELALGDRAAALHLADEVIAAGTMAPHFGELEAYWLRAGLDDRPGAARALDYVEVGTRLTWRARPRDIDSALDVFTDALRCDPHCVDAYWGRAEALRMQARLAAEAEDAARSTILRDGLAAWEGGRAFGPPGSAWPWMVHAQLCSDLAEVEPADARAWHVEALISAAACARRFTDWSAAWAALSRALLDLRCWVAAGWAATRCVELVPEWTDDVYYEAVSTGVVLLNLDPDEAARRFAEWEEIAADGDEGILVLTSACASILGRDVSGELPRTTEPYWTVWRLRTELLAGQLDDDAVRDALSEIDRELGQRLELLVDRARLRALLGDTATAEQLLAVAEAHESAADLDPIELDWVDFYLALRSPGRVHRRAAPLPATAAGLLTAVQELAWLRSRLTSTAAVALVDERLATLDARRDTLPRVATITADDVLFELDTAAASADEPRVVEALMGARTIAAALVKTVLEQAQDLVPPIRLALGSGLVPLDAGTNWSQWPLFTHSIPSVKQRLRDELGIAVPGIRVYESSDLPVDGWEVQFDGKPVRAGVVTAPPARGFVDEYPDDTLWSAPVAAVEAALLDDPSVSCLPSVVDDMLAEWRAEGSTAAMLTDTVAADPSARIALWQRLRHRLARDGRVPSWSGGLAQDVTELVLSGPSAMTFGTARHLRERS